VWQRGADLFARGRIKPHPDLLFAATTSALDATHTTTLAATAVAVALPATSSPIAAIATATIAAIAAIAAAIAAAGTPYSAATITATGFPVTAALPGDAVARGTSALSTTRITGGFKVRPWGSLPWGSFSWGRLPWSRGWFVAAAAVNHR